MIRFEKVTKRFSSGKDAVFELSFEIQKGETLVLLGRSGSGKTTALRLINRLIEATSGKIYIAEENILEHDLIDLRRHIGYAIQHIGLFPHMTVGENIGIVPTLLQWPERKIKARVEELLNMVGLEPKHFCELFPEHLSGGQKQRIGVARALAADPPIILLDEPFGALDPIMREQLQNEFLEIQSHIQKTVVFVTHDLSEAVKIGDRIAILEEGKLVQISTPEELIQNPANPFIDTFLGKDRFQLILQTQTLKKFSHALKSRKVRSDQKVSLNSSWMEALVAFNESETLSVYDQETYLGDLHRKQLLESLMSCFGQS
ncbi:MAG: Glycine betaine/carnitine/choline transport ATP-binding protein OpuCA [Chlamydiae bacterium]|nr:Glycine betaine/carnitine/choline transport ATP-binding protein OpuCA [Chlamydiota bacterium]